MSFSSEIMQISYRSRSSSIFHFNREEEFIEIETYFSLSCAAVFFATVKDEEACKKELAINYLSHAGYLHLSSSSPLTIDRRVNGGTTGCVEFVEC
jgi:hypothetical protein